MHQKHTLIIILLLTLPLTLGAKDPNSVLYKILPAPHQSLPEFIGYVPNELIVVFNQDARRQVTVKNSSSGPQVNIPSVQSVFQQHDIQHISRQFKNARPQSSASRFPDLTGYYKIKLGPGGNINAAVKAFEADSSVDHVEKIGIHTMYGASNDPYYNDSPSPSFPYDQWSLWDSQGIDVETAWDTETGGSGVIVAILDSGTRYFHVDLGGNSALWGPNNPFSEGNIFINIGEIPGNGADDDGNGFVDDTIGWDFVATTGGFGVSCIDQDCSGVDNDPDDGDGHGTHTAGTIGAITNNGVLVAGIVGGFGDGTAASVGNGVKIVPLRIGYHAQYRGQITGIVRMDWAAEAMNYVADLVDDGNNVTAINASWGSSDSGGLNAAVDNLLAHDVMIVHAAGNSNSSSADFLGNKAGVMNVAATDIDGKGASFTNHGPWVDVAAPGVDIVSTYKNPDDPDPAAHYIALLSGTSMSAPHVAGIAALLESCDPTLTGPDKFALITNNNNITDYTDSRNLGSGIANANLALQAAECTTTSCDITTTDFSASSTSACNSLTVDFTDLSNGSPTSWTWDFGDDNSSTEQNPSHTYTEPGTYSVSLTTSNSTCSNSETKMAFITISGSPVADFIATPTSGTDPLVVNFSDASGGNPTSWLWNFGDGNSSTEENPSHTYIGLGSNTVTLTAMNACDSDSQSKPDYITVEPVPPSNIVLTATLVSKGKSGKTAVNLAWTGANGSNVDIYRDGGFLTTTANDGSYSDKDGASGNEYQACEESSATNCSSGTTVL